MACSLIPLAIHLNQLKLHKAKELILQVTVGRNSVSVQAPSGPTGKLEAAVLGSMDHRTGQSIVWKVLWTMLFWRPLRGVGDSPTTPLRW